MRVAAFLAGGALRLPPGTPITRRVHLCDWYATLLGFAGVGAAAIAEEDARAARFGLPPLDSIDHSDALRGGVATVPAAGRLELPLSSNAIIIGDLKLVLATFIHKAPGPYHGRGVGALRPNRSRPEADASATAHASYKADPGCAPGGCLFNLTHDPYERHGIV